MSATDHLHRLAPVYTVENATGDRFLTGKQAHRALARALSRPHVRPHVIDDCGFRVEPHAIIIAVTFHGPSAYPRRDTFLIERTEHATIQVRALDYADLCHTEPIEDE